MSLDVISIAPTNGHPPHHTVVMLHGWGANAEDLVPIASLLSLPHAQFLFPHAPFPHPQVPGGRAWYALETNDYQGLGESQQMLTEWLLSLEEQTGVPLNRTILSGFSQGGAMSLDVGLNLPLAGICSLSGYLHFQPQAFEGPIPPILMIHGKQDLVVPLQAAHQARETLTLINGEVAYHELNMGHEIPPQVLPIFREFIENHTNKIG